MGGRGGQPSPATSEQAGNQLQSPKSALPPVIQKKRIAKEEQNEHQRKKDQRKQSGKARGMSRTNDKSLRASGS